MARLSSSPGVIDIGSGLEYLSGSGPTGDSPVVVTFDDGTADFVEVALPVLARYRVPAVLYLATDFIETGRSFPDAGRPTSWPALVDALSTGLVTIGSHTHSHLLLDRCDPDLAASDIARSVGVIEDRLGVRAEHFAYPKALLGSPDVQAIVRETFRSAAVAGTRPNPFAAYDPYRLFRSPVQVEDGLGFFSAKVRGGMALEDRLRRTVNRRRMAGATY
jgi:peptidoglycan/xylan/chitin deacetylase (PgdA/CDA1 family)